MQLDAVQMNDLNLNIAGAVDDMDDYDLYENDDDDYDTI